MLTSAYLNYFSYKMRDDYVNDPLLEGARTAEQPLDFGAIDAPDCIAAGGYYSYQSTCRPGFTIPLPITASREANI